MRDLPDGVYIGLPTEDYFAQERLGSSDLVLLHNRPADYWYASRANPNRAEREFTEEMAFGSALHILTLEGEQAFSERTVRSQFDDFRTREARLWRDWQRLNGKIILSEDMERRVRHMSALILNHPELGEALREGLSEVSVFFTGADGTKLRSRFDKLLPRFVLDLKTFHGEVRGRDLKDQCLGLVAARHMDVQRYLYALARNAFSKLVLDRAIFGASPEQADWLRKVAVVDDWSWVWIFFRRRDDKRGHAPMVQPVLRGHGDATFESGKRKVETGLRNHRAFVERFGLETPWALIEPVWEPADHDFPAWLVDIAAPAGFPAEEDIR